MRLGRHVAVVVVDEPLQGDVAIAFVGDAVIRTGRQAASGSRHQSVTVESNHLSARAPCNTQFLDSMFPIRGKQTMWPL